MKTVNLESRQVAKRTETEMRKGKSLFQALAIAALEAQERQERQKMAITSVYVDEADKFA